MATKLTQAQLDDLKRVGIEPKTKTEEEARVKLLSFLKQNEVEGVDNDPLTELIQFAEVFYEAPATQATEEVEEIEPELEEEGLDELAEEVTEVAKKAPVKKATPAPTAKQQPKKAVRAVSAAEGEKFDARNNPKHEKMLDVFRKVFPAKEYQIDILKQGFTVRVLGGNAKTTILNFDELRIKDGELIGNLYTNRFKSPEDLAPFLPEFENEKNIGMYRGESHPSIRNISQSEVFDVLKSEEGFLAEVMKRAEQKDTKMGINRQKLEETLSAAKKPAVKKPTGKKAEVEPEPELEEELELEPELEPEIEEAPPVKKAPAKKAAPAKKK